MFIKKFFSLVGLFLIAAQLLGQQQSKTLYYVATALNSVGDESAFSNEVNATLSPAHPTANLSWIASSTPNVEYNVYRSNVSGGPYVKLNSSLITVLVYSDTYPFPSSPKMNPPVVP